MSLQQWVCVSFLHIFSIVSRSCSHLGTGPREWILILRARHPILSNTRRPFWCMWRMNTVPNIDVCRSINLKVYRPTISSTAQWLQDLVNLPVIYMIWTVMMQNTWCLTMWLKWHLDEVILQHTNWPPPGSFWNHHLSSISNGSKSAVRFRVQVVTKLTHCNGFYHIKNPNHTKPAVFWPVAHLHKLRTMATIKYLSSDRVTIWYICKRCISGCSFISWSPICDPINIHSVSVTHGQFSAQIQRDSMNINHIAIGTRGGERASRSASFTYKSHCDTIRTPILNWSTSSEFGNIRLCCMQIPAKNTWF